MIAVTACVVLLALVQGGAAPRSTPRSAPRPGTQDDAGALVVPASAAAPPVFGIRDGIRVAVHPAALDARPEGGPRGLIRVGLEIDGKNHLVNYIAIEPVVDGRRGLSELEQSGDGRPGKRFTLRAPDEAMLHARERGAPTSPLPWAIEETTRGRSVRFMIDCERFANGAHPLVEVTLFERDPLAVRLRTYAADDSAPMESVILTATMANQSRARDLWLADAVISARELYDGYRGHGFTDREPYALDRLHRTRGGDVVVAITSDEYEPSESRPFANGAWRSTVPWLTQYWRKPKAAIDPDLRVRVNGRRVYWGGRAPIPCGTAYENFELIEPFHPGDETWFGLSLASPAKLFGFPQKRPPQSPFIRAKISAEETAARDQAKRTNMPLRNGDFTRGFEGWTVIGPESAFRIFEQDGAPRVTSFGAGGDRDTGLLFQCFVIPMDATTLRFFVHGGADPRKAAVRLWRGDMLWRWTSARDDNEPFAVEWDVRPLRGNIVTLEIEDRSTEPWGFIGAHGFSVQRERRGN